jgi:hypothetical protein
MLEAALLGVPYEGHMPDFSARWAGWGGGDALCEEVGLGGWVRGVGGEGGGRCWACPTRATCPTSVPGGWGPRASERRSFPRRHTYMCPCSLPPMQQAATHAPCRARTLQGRGCGARRPATCLPHMQTACTLHAPAHAPCRDAEAGPPRDPSVHEGRSLRWEQDQAYEESLAADRSV